MQAERLAAVRWRLAVRVNGDRHNCHGRSDSSRAGHHRDGWASALPQHLQGNRFTSFLHYIPQQAGDGRCNVRAIFACDTLNA